MALRKVLKNWGIRAGSVGALHLVLLAAAAVSNARAEPPANNSNAGQTPATKPAGDAGAQVQVGDADALKRLIEQKVAEQGQSSNAAQPKADAPQPTAKQASSSSKKLSKPQPAALHKAEATATSAPRGVEGEQPSLDLTPPPSDQPQPRWSCANDSIEKPAVWESKGATYTFTARNEGEGPLNIQIKGCCGSKISGLRSRTLQPGQTEDIEVTIATSGREGEFTRKIRVQTNDANNPQVELTCKGRVLTAFRTDPKVVNLGRIERDSGPVTKTIMLTRGDGGPLQPKVEKTENLVTAELREVEAGEKYALDITVSPPWPNDKLRGSVTLATGLEEAPEETVRLFGQVDPRLRTEPKSFVLPASAEQETDLRVELIWAGTPGKAVGATATDQALTAKVVEEEGRQFVTLHVPANYDHKQKAALSVSVVTDDPAVSSLRIPITTSAGAASVDKTISRPAKMAPRPMPVNLHAGADNAAQPTTQPGD